jgi:hypothetical protein
MYRQAREDRRWPSVLSLDRLGNLGVNAAFDTAECSYSMREP